MLFSKEDKKASKVKRYVEAGETKDYSMFIFPAHQRDRNNNNVKGIMESIKEHGVISAVSVRPSVSHHGKFEVYDGQHTVLACKRLNAPVIYNIFNNVSNRAMIALNGKTRKWKMTDYLKFGVTDNIDDYVFLNKIYNQEKLPLTALIMMYGGSYQNKSFKSLSWKSLTINRGNTILGYIKDLEMKFNISHCRHARFIWGLSKVYDTGIYDHERMLIQLSKCSQLMTKQSSPGDYARNIEMIYNYGLTKKSYVQFVQ